MVSMRHLSAIMLCFVSMLGQSDVFAQNYTITFRDPAGDDNGPGTYVYPTDAVYKKGSFDMLDATFKVTGDDVQVSIGVNCPLEDPWRTGAGFAVQMIFVFIDADDKLLSGHQQSIPGLNNKWAMGSGWEKCIIICPAGKDRVNKEIDEKAAALKSDIVVPDRVKAGTGRMISAYLKKSALGDIDLRKCKFQVVMCSYEGFPDASDLFVRKVNEYEGQHRFGGGNDGDCDPNIIDCLAGTASGAADEGDKQHRMLGSYKCKEDGTAASLVLLPFIGPQASQIR